MQLIYKLCLLLVYLILLVMAIILITNIYVCDDYTCTVFNPICKDNKKQLLHLLDKLCEDGVWPFPYITASILTCLIVSILPIYFSIRSFIIVFLVSFIVFYCILAFMIHHYVIPIKQYIIDYINTK